MEEKTALLSRIYGRAGNRGIKFLLYLVFFSLHFVLALSSHLPAIDPNEFTSAAIANMFIGGDWTAAMSRSDYYYGFLQAVLYIPAMLLTNEPFIQYSIMIVINGAVMSFIPVIVFSVCNELGVQKPWQSVFAAVCTGGWMTCFVHSKFIWNETAAIFLPFLLIYLLLKSDKAEKKSGKRFYSIVTALVCGLCYCAHQRLFAAVLAVSVTALLSRFFLKRKSLNLPVFFVSLVILMTAAVFGNYLVQELLWGVSDPRLLNNTAERFFADLPAMLSDGGVQRWFTALASQLYYYLCASWGLGALAFSAAVVVIARLIRGKKDKSLIIFGGQRAVFLFYALLLTIFMLFIGVCYRFGAESFATSQSTMLFGRYMDGVIPFAVMTVFVFIYTEELNLVEILGGIITLSVSYLLFFLTGRSGILESLTATLSPILGIYPVMFGENSGALVTSTGLTAAVSCGMCVMTVFIVIVSCAKRLKNVNISVVITVLTVYSTLYGIFGYLPLSNAESVSKNSEYVKISSYIYNSPDAPSVTVYSGSRSCVMMMQYLNQNIKVYTADTAASIREDTYIIVPEGVQLRFEGQGRIVFVQLAETENYKIYAYGERAKAYAQSQSGSEEEQEITAQETREEAAEPDEISQSL